MLVQLKQTYIMRRKIIQFVKYDMKEEIIHPLFVAKKDKYADLFVDKLSVVESKVGKANS